MMHPRRGLGGALVAIAALAIGACAGAPRERPLQTGPIETGGGSLNDTRKALEAPRQLASLEVVGRYYLDASATPTAVITWRRQSGQVARWWTTQSDRSASH